MKAPTLAALALLLVAGRGVEERVVERRFTSELELSTEHFELTGTEAGHSETQEPPHQVREQAYEIVLTDTLFDDQDPPAKFTRLYGTVVSSFELGDERSPRSKTESAGLEGKTVTFELERDGSYSRTCDDTDVRPGQLKRLRAELSLACFLPKHEESEGEEDDGNENGGPPRSWELENADLARLFSPLETEPRRPRAKLKTPKGALNLAPAGLSVPMGALLHAPEGTMTATLRASSEDDELPFNATLEFRLTSTFDGSAGLAEDDALSEDELELVYAGTGALAWNPADGRIEITCKGELRLTENLRAEVEGNGKTAEIEGRLVLTGTLECSGRELNAD